MRLRRACALGIFVFGWSFPAVAAPPAASDPAAAREQLKIGYTLAQDGKCSEALPHLAESLRLDPRAITLINLADCEEKVGKLSDAMAHWVDARGRAQAEGQKPIEEEATARAGTLEGRLSRLTIVLSKTAPPDAVVERDGIALGPPSMGVPLPLDPGAHTIVVKAKGHENASRQLTLAEGEKQTLEVDVGAAAQAPAAPPAAAASSSTSSLVFIGFGIAAVGIGVGAVTGVIALGAGSNAEKVCPGGTCPNQKAIDDIAAGRTMGTISTIAFIAGGVGAAIGVYGLVWGGTKKTEPAVDVGFAGSRFVLRARF